MTAVPVPVPPADEERDAMLILGARDILVKASDAQRAQLYEWVNAHLPAEYHVAEDGSAARQLIELRAVADSEIVMVTWACAHCALTATQPVPASAPACFTTWQFAET